MTIVPGPRTAAATRARQQQRALRLAADLVSVLDLLETAALAALIVVIGDEIGQRRVHERVTTVETPSGTLIGRGGPVVARVGG